MSRRVRMTEDELLKCHNPDKLLSFLRSRYAYPYGEESNRKIRLFSCAVCRRAWHLLTDKRWRRGIELSELYTDKLLNAEEFEEATNPIVQRSSEIQRTGIQSAATKAILGSYNSYDVISDLEYHLQAAEGSAHCELLREIFGNPFHSIVLDKTWLTWNDSTVAKLTQTIYSENSFDLLPILGDALEDSGCSHPLILTHCRLKQPHVKGCWVVDLLKGWVVPVGSWNYRLQEGASSI